MLRTYISILAILCFCPVEAAVLYVDGDRSVSGDGKSWASAYKTIQEAVQKASGGDEIRVKGGTYSLQQPIVLSGEKQLSLYGGFAGNEEQPSDRAVNDNDGNGLTESWEFSAKTVLDGGNRCQILQIEGNGTFTVDGFSMENGASSSGFGGVYLNSPYSRIKNSIVRNCYVKDLQADFDGAAGIKAGNGTISGCLIECNTTDGTGGSYNVRGGGVYLAGEAVIEKSVIRNNRIITNRSAGSNLVCAGGGIYMTGTSRAATCVVANNELSGTNGTDSGIRGGGICAENGGSILSCTVVMNKAAGEGGGIFAQSAPYTPVNIRNSLIWGNESTLSPNVKNLCLSNQEQGSSSLFCLATNGGYTNRKPESTVSRKVNTLLGNAPDELKFAHPSSQTGYITDAVSAGKSNWQIGEGSCLIDQGRSELLEAGTEIPVTIKVSNNGTIWDTGEVKLLNGKTVGSRRFYVDPGTSETFTVPVTIYQAGQQQMIALVDNNSATLYPVEIEASAPRIELRRARIETTPEEQYVFRATGYNPGSSTLQQRLTLYVDEQSAQEQNITLSPGESKEIVIPFSILQAGDYNVRIGNLYSQTLHVAGGLKSVLEKPAVYLAMEEGSGTVTKNEVTGKTYPMTSGSSWATVDGNKVIRFTNSGNVNCGNIDLYQKNFTLAARVKIEALTSDGKASFFGGMAPSGAGQDQTSTNMHIGVKENALYAGLLGNDLKGSSAPAVGNWANIAYVMDADNLKGTWYLNGIKNGEGRQTAYLGPLQTIGYGSRLGQGTVVMKEVLVTLSALDAAAIKDLAQKGISGLKKGEYISEWRTLNAPVQEVISETECPDGTVMKLYVESADNGGNIIESKEIVLGDKKNSYSAEMKNNAQKVRIRIVTEQQKWSEGFSVRSIALKNGGTLIWSIHKDWIKGTASGALRFE